DYVRAKERIFLNQTDSDYAVLNGNDLIVASMGRSEHSAPRDLAARSVFFSSAGRSLRSGEGSRADIYLQGGVICTSLLRDGKGEVTVIPAAQIPIVGMHNVENVMAALGAVFCAVAPDTHHLPPIVEAIKQFKGVEHRIEFVATVDGVKFYNDSKATN